MKTTFLSLAAAASLFAVPALAYDHDANAVYRDDPNQYSANFVTKAPGHYELRSFQKWEEGHYQQVWVPGACFGLHVQVCSPGSYRQEWVPGRYVTAQQYVWVEYRHHHGWGRFNPHNR
jgi:hypothetical protein